MKYLVHIKPSEEICERVVDLRKRLDLKEIRLPPHCTLYTLYANPTNEEKIIETLRSIREQPFEIFVQGSDFFDDEKVVLLVQKDPALMGLHGRIIQLLKDFVDLGAARRYSGEARREEIWKQYGSAYVAEGYNPHITIGEGTCNEMPEFTASWRAHSFRLFKKDTIWKPVSEFTLQ